MQSLFESLPQLVAYQPAFTALAILCLAILAQSFLAGILGLGKGEETPGMPLKGDHTKFSFRTIRTYANSVENFSVFSASVLLAIIAGVGAVFVNWLAIIHVVFRLAYWAVYYNGVGKVGGGIRTITYVLGLLANIILSVMVAYALLT
ncbi:MAG: MAPEG family protein [Salaquimonas sp.]